MRRLAVGLITAAHGLSGSVKIKSFSGESAHLLRLKLLYLRRGEEFLPFEVQAARGSGAHVVMKLAGIDSPEAAARYRGCELWVERGEASALGQGEYYLADLCRCRVYRGQDELGRVIGVLAGGGNDLLEVEDGRGRRFLLPFVEAFVGRVDVGDGRIEVQERFEIP
jgi:16S rRNA processing protein RimM